MCRYAVIGGQYDFCFYGFADTLHAAKLLATRHEEYWDNWQGWHTPKIYSSADVFAVENFYGSGFAPCGGCIPVAVKIDGKWSVFD